eukprot:10182029-Ditylum_brightwellii.AAC.1
MVHCSLSKGMSAGGMIKNIFNAAAGLYKFYKYGVNDLDLSKLMLYLGWKSAPFSPAHTFVLHSVFLAFHVLR